MQANHVDINYALRSYLSVRNSAPSTNLKRQIVINIEDLPTKEDMMPGGVK